MHKQIVVLPLTLFTSSVFVLSATDTPETRRHEAERYLRVSPPKAPFEYMAIKWLQTFRRINASNSSE